MDLGNEAELAQGPTVGGNSLGSAQAQLCLSLSTPNQPLEHSGTNWQWLSQNLALPLFFSRNWVFLTDRHGETAARGRSGNRERAVHPTRIPDAFPALTHVDEAHDQVGTAQVSLRWPAVVVIGHGVIQVQHEEGRGCWLPSSGGWRTGSGSPG